MASRRPCCLLCGKSEENSVTGPLATKDGITAHQNCLLYASGIYCKDSPEYDDLFGFSVEDVKQEGKRGKKLRCHSCKHRGATAGCEVKRCTRSYHYPCAVHSNADFIENQSNGLFQLFCEQHRQKANGSAQNDGATNQGEGSKARQDVI
ncbi:PHD finger protein 6 [Clupea harengus]|uniref:PHD finger protein 6 n=1 Tax=Clupea harengus TaxID=7950 RepID=A0A8M1K5D4_CLUHA|nr:PHD finger protein 6 [Clupea harengus]